MLEKQKRREEATGMEGRWDMGWIGYDRGQAENPKENRTE